ncbi:MAG TPA: hypothetical protein VGI06_15465 [Acidimicrobiales bacterium]
MQHMVVYRSLDGKPSYFQADDLEGAVRQVEHLRNAENVVDSRIFQMEEVPIEFRPYYRVELSAAASPPASAPAEGAEPVAVAVGAEPVGEMVGPTPVAGSPAASRFGLFSRG